MSEHTVENDVPVGRHSWICPECGRECRSDAGYRARQRQRCLFCIRKANGWQHQPGCTGSDEHRGPCVTPPEMGEAVS